MRINWKNIYGILGVILGIHLISKAKPLIDAWIDSLQDSSRLFEKHPALPFFALGVICVTAVAIAKILSKRNK